MRVALVVERFEAAGGGVEHAVWNVARELVLAGDDVHVVAREGVEAAGVTLHRVEVPRFWQPLRVLRFSSEAAREVERGEFDVVHSFCRTRRQDVFHAGGGSHWHYMQSAYGRTGRVLRRASPRHAVQLQLERRIFEDPSQWIQCVSSLVRDQIAERFAVPAQRLVVVHNGVDAASFAPDLNEAAGRALRAAGGVGDATLWLFSGSGWRRKGLDTALRALAAGRDQRALLWVAGADATAPWLRLAESLGVAARVSFLGMRSDMPQLYAAADAVLLPTRYDAFALVALEAAAAARPIVISAAAGAAELVHASGVVVRDAEEVAAVACAMDRLGDPAVRAQLGKAGLEIAARHDWRSQVGKLRDLYARAARA